MADGVFRKVPVEIKDITGRLIEGVINLPTTGYKTRLSDYVNDTSKHFIALTNAIISNEGVVEKKYKSIIISKSAIVHIVELEEKS
ncbi:MAG: hypothetical protein J7L54_07545 [Elusimicrobia bacterium]|nr:hypothetical protein [Elusimicrobiota bacterium]